VTAYALVTPQQAAANYRTTVAYIYKLANRDRWRRIRHAGRVYYDLHEIDRTLGNN
jgi:hypothetical protein